MRNKEEIQKLLNELKFEEEYGYPHNDAAYLMFLEELGIRLRVLGGEGESFGTWCYLIENNRSHTFIEDNWSDVDYDTFEEAFNEGLLESLKCVLEAPES